MLHSQILDSQSCTVLQFDSCKSNVFRFKLKKAAQMSITLVEYFSFLFSIQPPTFLLEV